MRSRGLRKNTPLFLCLLAAGLAAPLTGCGQPASEGPIPPLPPAEGRINPGLGPDARPISTGPGYKGSPSWSPDGGRVAFIKDGYVADRTVEDRRLTRWTTRDFGAVEAEWTAGGALIVLGGPGAVEGRPGAAYKTDPDEGSLGVEEIVGRVLAMAPGREGFILALRTGRAGSGISLLQDGRVERAYTTTVPGTVTGISPSPDGDRVALAVRPPEGHASAELHVFDLRSGESRRISDLEGDRGIFGAPQWTNHGIYFVAGAASRGDDEPLYDLYRTSPEPGEPEPAPGVGEDFAAGGARVSPGGARLAVVGRLNPTSPLNLYVLDTATGAFDAVTTNEDMEIKTGPDDLAWSPSGTSVAIVARCASTGEPKVRATPADQILDDFYNLYEVPIAAAPAPPEGRR
jgi:TolB protein